MSKVKRRWLAGMAVLVLAALNAWQWWPSDAHALAVESAPAQILSPADFRVHGVIATESARGIARDLFVVSPSQPLAAELVPVLPAPVLTLPQAELDDYPVSRSHLAEYRLEGTLVRGGRIEAFLGRANERYRIVQGDRLDDGTAVVRVEAERVVLQDSGGENHTLWLKEQ